MRERGYESFGRGIYCEIETARVLRPLSAAYATFGGMTGRLCSFLSGRADARWGQKLVVRPWGEIERIAWGCGSVGEKVKFEKDFFFCEESIVGVRC